MVSRIDVIPMPNVRLLQCKRLSLRYNVFCRNLHGTRYAVLGVLLHEVCILIVNVDGNIRTGIHSVSRQGFTLTDSR